MVSFEDKHIDVHSTDSSSVWSCNNDPEKNKWDELILLCEKTGSLKKSSIYRFLAMHYLKVVCFFMNGVHRGDHCKVFTYTMCFIVEFSLNDNFKGSL